MAKTAKNIYRAIAANKLRFLSVALVVAVGITLFIGMITAFIHLDRTYKTAFKDHNMASFTVQTANPGGSGSDAWIDYNNLTTYINNYITLESRIESFELRIVYDTIFNVRGTRQNGRIVAFNTTDSNGIFREQPSVNGYKVLSGQNFTASSQFRNVCLMDAHLAEYWKVEPYEFIAVGDDLVPFQVLGILASPEYLMNMGSYSDLLPSPRRFGVIFTPLRTAQQLLNVPGKVNEISIKLESDLSANEREQIAKNMKEYLENTYDLKLSEPIDIDKQVSYYLLRLDIEEARELGLILPIIFLGMACGGLYVLLGRMVVAERKDIGVAQALGYSRRSIILQYLGIAFVVSIVGTIIGIVFGLLFLEYFSPIYVEAASIPFPAMVTFEWQIILLATILGLITGFIGGYLPVKSAIQPLPAESLRFDPSLHITTGRVPLVERILNKIYFKPRVTGLRLPIRNFFRSKKRTVSSVFAVVISVSIICMGIGMVDSMDYALRYQSKVVEDWDLRIDYGEIPTNASDIVTAIKNIDGVQNCTYHLLSGATVFSNKSSKSKSIQLIGIKEKNGYLGHKFDFESGNYSSNDVVLSVPIAEKLRVWTGDVISLEIPKLTNLVSTVPLRARFEMVNITFKISGIIDEFNGLVAFVGLEHLKEVSNFPGDPANTILLKVDNPTPERLEEIREIILENFSYNIRNIYSKEEQSGDLLELLELVYLLMYIIAIFAIVLAAAMVYNTVYISLKEQQREIATLLTMGTQNRKIVRNVTIENLIITIIGTFFGVILGWILLWFMMTVVMDLEFFRVKIFISVETIIISFLLTFIGVLIAQYFPLRRTLNLNLAEATKERVV